MASCPTHGGAQVTDWGLRLALWRCCDEKGTSVEDNETSDGVVLYDFGFASPILASRRSNCPGIAKQLISTGGSPEPAQQRPGCRSRESMDQSQRRTRDRARLYRLGLGRTGIGEEPGRAAFARFRRL